VVVDAIDGCVAVVVDLKKWSGNRRGCTLEEGREPRLCTGWRKEDDTRLWMHWNWRVVEGGMGVADGEERYQGDRRSGVRWYARVGKNLGTCVGEATV
jgi:hypothetical protein